jgi:hypothetical protein
MLQQHLFRSNWKEFKEQILRTYSIVSLISSWQPFLCPYTSKNIQEKGKPVRLIQHLENDRACWSLLPGHDSPVVY